jgi:aminopeptidase N
MSTRSFEAAVEQAFGQPMDWFFDQWVYGVEVPTYRVDLDVSPVIDNTSPFILHGRVRQEDVPDGFKMPVPIRLTFDSLPPVVHRIWMDKSEVLVELPLPARPTKIEFNAQHAVLAKIR